MADVGDRITVASNKGGPRSGAVTAVSGDMITVRWDTGGQTSLIAGPGVLTVMTSRQRTRSAHTRPTASGLKAAAKKTNRAGSLGGVAKKAAPGTKAAAGKKPVAKKVSAGKKPVAKGAPSNRTTAKKKTR